MRFYCYDREHHTLDSAGFIEENPTEHTVSFYTASFSDYFPVEWTDLDYWRSVPTEVDTGFRPIQNGWFMTNRGSYVEPMGCCLGMVNYAKWFYRHKTVDNWQEVEGIGGWNKVGPNLYDKYREGRPEQMA